MVAVPEFATHYHLRGREPFLNLSDLTDEGVAAVLSELDAVANAGGSQRRFGPRYMALRRTTEQRLRERFIARGGRPQRRSPHYFVLGESDWFKRLYLDAAEVRVPLDQLPSEVTSFTYPDSVVAMGALSEFGIATVAQPYHGTVFRLEELPNVVEAYGLPNDTPPQTYDGYQRRPGEHFIEVQLWSDEPLARFS